MEEVSHKQILKDPAAFEKFFKEKYRPLCGIAFRFLRDMDQSEEIVQEVMVRLWEKRDQIDIKGPLLAYLTTSIKNTCLNHIKHKNIVYAHEKSEAQRFAYDPAELEEEIGDMELEAAVLNAIAELPPQRRKIFSLSRVDGLKYHEIADQMGLSIKTVEAQMGSALKQLRIKLKDFVGLIIVFNFFISQ